jgi:transposase InsO family protein
MANENPGWGYTRIRGALRNLGHELGRSTIQRILAEAGIEPAPERSRRPSWGTFLKAHWGAIAAMDFFTIEALTMHRLVRYSVLFVIDLKTRCVQLAGVAHDPHGPWMEQVARNLTDAVDGCLRNTRYLIHDRDPLFTQRFAEILRVGGVKTVKLPARSPNLNAYADRFVLSVRTECLSRVIPLGEQHLRTILAEYVEHHHTERNHQVLNNELLRPLPANTNAGGAIHCERSWKSAAFRSYQGLAIRQPAGGISARWASIHASTSRRCSAVSGVAATGSIKSLRSNSSIPVKKKDQQGADAL